MFLMRVKNQQLVGGKLEVGDGYYVREQFHTPLILELLLLCKLTVSGFWSLLLHTSMSGQNPVWGRGQEILTSHF